MTSAARGNLRPILLAIAIFAALSLTAGLTSRGFLEADAVTHFMQARSAFRLPQYFVNIWGRPIFTTLYAIPAVLGGQFGTELMSLILAIGCGLVAFRIAQNQKYRWPALALIFTLGQPLVFLHSFSQLTELPFALLIGLAFLAYQRGRFGLMAILIALSPLSRPEGFGFLVLAAVSLIVHRRWWWLVVLPLPLALWSYEGWRLYGQAGHWWSWLIDSWPYAMTSLYDRGNILQFVALLPAVTSPLLFPATCLGIWRSLRRAGGRGSEHCQMLIAAIPLLILVGHSVLFALGKMASNGELRYMLIVAPFWGLLSAYGWEWIFERLNWTAVYRVAGVAVLLPIIANICYPCVPLKLSDDDLAARRAADWYQHSGLSRDFPRISSGHQMLYYFLGTIGTDRDHAVDWRRDTLAAPPPGTIAIWDPIYAVFNSDANRSVPLDELMRDGWIDITDRVPPIAPKWRIFLSPKTASGSDADVQALPRSPSSP